MKEHFKTWIFFKGPDKIIRCKKISTMNDHSYTNSQPTRENDYVLSLFNKWYPNENYLEWQWSWSRASRNWLLEINNKSNVGLNILWRYFDEIL